MKEIIYTILSYLASAVSVAGFAVIAKVILKKIADFDTIKHHLGFIVKKLNEAQETNEKLQKRLETIEMQLKGHRENGKEVKKN